jgi:hypothetical protein
VVERSGRSHTLGRRPDYSITSSASAITVGGTVRPSVVAVLRLMANSNLAGACVGRSAGLAPFKMRSTYEAARRVEPAAPRFRSQLRDGPVDLMKGFSLGSIWGAPGRCRRPATRSTRATADGEITWDTRSWDASASVPKPEERTSVNFRSCRLPPAEDPFC